MLSRILSLLSLLLFFYASNAQEMPAFGTPDLDELNLEACPFDPEAEAVILRHEARSSYNDDYNLMTLHHYRIKVLKDKGSRYADIVIPYYSENDFEYISELEGMVINREPDGTIKSYPLDRKAIFRQPINKYYSAVKFTLPAVKAGSILEYRYLSTMKSYSGLDNWEFQDYLPVIQSRYSLLVVPNAEFSYAVKKNELYNIDIRQDEKEGRVIFQMNNLPGLRDEPYMDARKDYLQQVTFQLSKYVRQGESAKKYMTSWDEVSREMLSNANFGIQLNKSLSGTDDFIKLARLEPDAYRRMGMVYNLVRSSMNWTGADGKWSSGIKEAWAKKNGSSADINLILINLLQNAGLDAAPLLVSERSHGMVNTSLPFIDQFNKALAAVKIDQTLYILDGTEKVCPPNIIPASVLNTSALLVKRRGGGIIEIKDDYRMYRQTINASFHVNENGVVSGNAFVSDHDYARVDLLEDYKQDKQDFIESNFVRKVNGLVIDSFTVNNEENDSLAFENKFQFRMPLVQTGDYSLLSLNLFNEYTSNPFVSDRRLSNINFGYKKSLNLNYILDIPAGYKLESVPSSMIVRNNDKTIFMSREILVDKTNNKIVARIRIENQSSWYPVSEYSSIREFYKKMTDMLNEPIVLKK